MKNILTLIAIVIISFSGIYNASSQNTKKYSKAKVYLNSGDLNRLASLGVAIDNGEVKKDKYIISEFSEREIGIIRENGFQYEILIDDVSKFYADRNKSIQDSLNAPKKKSVNAVSCSADKYPTPSYFSLGSVGGFYSYEEIMAELDSMHQRFPNLVSARQEVGSSTTIEGRKLWYVKISDNPGTNEAEPQVLYSALTHAREPQGMQQLFFFMYYLLENYNSNSTIKYVLDNTELYFVPCVNPDGYKLNQITNPNGGGMHRKNCRNTGGNPKGIDLNRNYGYQWGYDDIGSSPNVNDETYRGTGAFSEAETQLMKSFAENHSFKLCIDYHTYSNVLLYPWGYIDQITSDSSIFIQYAKLMTKTNGFIYGTPFQGIGYNANGGSFDWFYGEQTSKNKIIAFSPEAGDANDGFWPAMNRIEPISKSFADMNMYLALFAGKYAAFTENNSKFVGNPGYMAFNLQSLGLDTPATFLVTMIPVNSAMSGTGSPVNLSGMHLGESRTDSVSFTLSPGITPGQQIKFIFKIESSYGFYYSDTITKIYGTPADIFSDAANAMTNWTSTSWNTTTLSYHSASKSFTDSPSGNYNSNANTTITTTNYISLNNVLYAELTFWAKWDIEAGYDYVEVLASTNGTTWTPLCGRLNHPGNSNQDVDKPLYDGTQTTWVKEQVDLSDYLGQNIKLRFKLRSDQFSEFDGFYFDDIKVTVINNTTGISKNESTQKHFFTCWPNPCTEELNFRTDHNSNVTSLEIFNSLGMKCKSIENKDLAHEFNINITDLPAGIYLVKTNNGLITKFIKE